jgi:hypothetical protein
LADSCDEDRLLQGTGGISADHLSKTQHHEIETELCESDRAGIPDAVLIHILAP